MKEQNKEAQNIDKYCQLIFDKVAANTKRGKDSVSNKLF